MAFGRAGWIISSLFRVYWINSSSTTNGVREHRQRRRKEMARRIGLLCLTLILPSTTPAYPQSIQVELRQSSRLLDTPARVEAYLGPLQRGKHGNRGRDSP